MWAWRRAKPQISPQQALSARPLRLVEPEIQPVPDGGARLKVRLRAPALVRWFAGAPGETTRTYELDALGMFVWESCDGRTSVRQLIRRFAGRYDVNVREAEVAVVKFLQLLMKKGLIGMSVSPRR